MKKDRIIYWVTTGIVAAVMLVSALEFGLNPAMKGAFARVGLPDWFRLELTVRKSLAHWPCSSPEFLPESRLSPTPVLRSRSSQRSSLTSAVAMVPGRSIQSSFSAC
jgi:hypothetical protein